MSSSVGATSVRDTGRSTMARVPPGTRTKSGTRMTEFQTWCPWLKYTSCSIMVSPWSAVSTTIAVAP